MIAYIRGKLQHLTPFSVIIDTQGIGYEVYIPTSLFAKLPQIGSDIQLHTVFIIRENDQTLYGFGELREKELFDSLNSVRGVGPKLALSIIGHMPQSELYEALHEEDIKAISKIPGIGKKTAERLIVELRDKLSVLFHEPPPKETQQQRPSVRDALSALINLGYTQAEAQKAVQKSLEEGTNEEDLPALIMRSLSYAR